MMEVSRNGGLYRVTVSHQTSAPAEGVYDLLADLSTHIEWGGSWHPSRTQRLQSMEAPKGRATVGTEFWSIGTTSAGSWHDRSTVTQATRPTLFEFVTDGTLRDREDLDRMFLHALHRYEIAPAEHGSVVTYILSAQMTLQSPPGDVHQRLPAVIFNLLVPSVIERGTMNLARMAEERAGVLPITTTFAAPSPTLGVAGHPAR
jgi:Polyketide cyclase / dehydrase and lipid transport